jgi:hypothetical protein
VTRLQSFVLPIVTQLNDEPQVTEDDIVLLFPELQLLAASAPIVKVVDQDA